MNATPTHPTQNQKPQGDPAPIVGDRPVSSEVRSSNEFLANIDRTEQLVNEFFEEPASYQIDEPQCDVPSQFKMTVIIPVFNEENTIRRVVGRIIQIPINKEIIIVDDCSTDGTGKILETLKSHKDIKVVLKEENAGKGAALRTGFESATGDVVVIQDADLEYDPRDIPKLLVPLLQDESDVVYGSRFIGNESQDESWIHRFGNGLLTGVSNLTTGLKLTDMETCYKAFRREILADIEVEQNRFGFEPEITAKLARRKARFSEVPIGYNARTYAEGKKIGIKDLFNAFYCIARYGWFSRK
ncbi:glycosyltransferase family 2 protein [Pirellulaceae bacterium]|nr:glycosyltransferase family 2 protein [Pirellulaceae bacterium]